MKNHMLQRLAAHIVGLILVFFCSPTYSQGYISMSTQIGGSAQEMAPSFKVVNGETYVFGYSNGGTGYPVVGGVGMTGAGDFVVTKFGANGNIIYSTYLGGTGSEQIITGGNNNIEVVNGEVYVTAVALSAGYPSTSGLPFGGVQDIVVTKLNAAGAIAYSTYLGGANTETVASLKVINGEAYIFGNSSSSNYPVTNGSTNAGSSDLVLTKLSSIGTIAFSTYIGGTGNDLARVMDIANGEIALGARVGPGFPVTNGTVNAGSTDIGIVRLSIGGTISYSSVFGSTSASDNISGIILNNGNIYFLGAVVSGYPTTNGTYYKGIVTADPIVTKINSSGNVVYSSYVAGLGLETVPSGKNQMRVLNDELYIGITNSSPDYPVTNGSTISGGQDMAFTRFSSTGTIVYSTFLGGTANDNFSAFEVVNGDLYILGTSGSSNYPVTNGSTLTGSSNLVFTRLNSDGTICFSTFVGGSSSETSIDLQLSNGSAFLLGTTSSNNYPVTTGTSFAGVFDFVLTKIDFCPTFTIGSDPLTPATQNTCINGVVQPINGTQISIPGNSLPILYRNGATTYQNEIYPRYQWQRADAAGGPWTDIPGATDRNYSPPPSAISQYYRRRALQSPCCGSAVISTSTVSAVLVNSNNAPTANAGGVFNTCLGSPVTIGGTPSASGGLAPYTYSWDNGAGIVSNPLVNPATTTIYTLTVTDALGCSDIDQAVVTLFAANAGPDVSRCGANPVRIGSLPIAGLPGVTYSWTASPVDPSMSCTNCAQPDVNPSVTTTYTLTLTIPVTGGGTCTTNDAVVVTPIAAPSSPNFAGPDVTVCMGGTAVLGTVSEPGFTYTWAPGNYISSTGSAQPTFQPGAVDFPTPNPVVYYLTMSRSGCTFTDEVQASVIKADAGLDKCGPALIGTADPTPSVNETYSWTKISGPAIFLGATNTPIVPVSASGGGPSVFQVTVTHNGVSCTDQVTISDCGCPSISIAPSGPAGCPSYSLSGGNVTLTATVAPPAQNSDYNFSWSPAAGLNTTTGSVVSLTDNVSRTYTVTITNIADPSQSCQQTITVNNPVWSQPTFTAQDVSICAGTPINIGQSSVVGYTYQWQNSVPGLDNYTISNPAATVNSTTNFPITVTDNLSGCIRRDTATVTVVNSPANAGADFVVCSNGVITLGTPAQPNTTYSWSPATAPWQNGTDQTFAQPDVLVATNLTFTLTATNTLTGCVTTDQVDVVVNNSPTLAAPDITICAGSGGTIGTAALPGVSYSWSPAGGLSCSNCAQPVASPGSTTLYTLVATYPGGCTATDNVLVTVSNPSFSIPDISYCPSAGAFALAPTAPGGMSSYSWSPASQVSNATIANPNTLNPPPSSATTYTLTVTNAQGCTASDNVTITPSISVPTAGSNRSLCLSSSTTLGNASNQATDSWSIVSGPNTSTAQLSCTICAEPIFTPTVVGVYNLQVTRLEAGCVSESNVTITVTSFSLPTFISPTICDNSCVQIGGPSQVGVSYVWSPAAGLSNSTIANPIACVGSSDAVYSLTATNLNGCIARGTVFVSVNPALTPQVSINPIVACLGDLGQTFNPAISPVGTYNYTWTPNDGSLNSIYIRNAQVNVMALGVKNYRLTVTNTATGCSNFADATLTVNLCTLIPVKLEEFEVKAKGNTAVLSWKVSDQVPGTMFYVEHSVDGIHFREINSIGSTRQSTYQWSDLNPANGKNYYRLKVVSPDNKEPVYSTIKSVSFIDSKGQIKLYPNPTNNILMIAANSSLLNKQVLIRVIGVDGRIMLIKRIKSMSAIESIDLTNVPIGQYIINMSTNKDVLNQIIQIIR